MPNYVITKKGPLIPPNVNQKSFVSVKIPPMGGEHKFKTGNVAKMTAGKVKLDNTDEAEKDDIIECTAEVTAKNEQKDDHAACRTIIQRIMWIEKVP